jgi:hypothetical protein
MRTIVLILRVQLYTVMYTGDQMDPPSLVEPLL